MTKTEQYFLKQLLQDTLAVLRPIARESHPQPPRGAIVTRDMCACGMTTGVGATDKCALVNRLQQTVYQIEALEK